MHRKKFYSSKFAKNSSLGLCNRLKSVLSVFERHDFERILDIGCGDGSFTILLSNFSDEIYGVDIAEETVESARNKNIKAYEVDIEEQSLPFGTNYFGAIYCGEVLEHVYDPDRLLNEIHRVLSSDGICTITTPNLSWWLNRLVLLLGFQPYLTEVSLKYNVGKLKAKPPWSNIDEISGHIRSFTSKSLKELLELNGFEVVEMLRTNVADVLPFPVNS